MASPITNTHGHIVSMRRCVDADVMSSRRIDVNTTSSSRRVPARIYQVSLATCLLMHVYVVFEYVCTMYSWANFSLLCLKYESACKLVNFKLAESLPLKDYPSWQFSIMTDTTFAKLTHTTENKILYRSTLPKPGMHFSLYSMLHATYVLQINIATFISFCND